MMVSLLDRLLHRPYHSAIVHGPFDARRLALDYAKRVFRSQTMINQKGRKSVEQLLLVLDSGLFAFFDGMVLTLYAGSPEAADAAARDFRKYVRPWREEKAHFFVVRVTETGAVAEPVEVERSAPITTQDLRLYYGEEFVAWTDDWLRQVQERPSGLTMLHGPPGVGKTSFLRALMHRLLDRAAFYYLPASEAQLLSSSRFLGFWACQARGRQHRLRFVILEDAEDLLLPRGGGSRERVSSLLNIADGFLGDYLKLHVLATINVPISHLDPAIVRPGRLVGAREFRPLSRAEAQRLASAKGLTLPDQQKFTLAEDYGGADDASCTGKHRQIGFA